jgi:membrane associated rhomboid family serine protease
MFLPLHDDTHLQVIRFQFVTIAIIVLNVVIFLFTGAFTTDVVSASIDASFGLTPAELLHASRAAGGVPEPLTLITSMFLHGGWMHLIGNMLFMWVFADNVEDAYGYVGFAIFYLLSGVMGGLTHVLMSPASQNPLIGASGAVSGILAAYLILYPRARVWILLFMRIPVPLPAVWVLGSWFLLQVYSLAAAAPGADIAWWDHMGGFATGIILTLVLRSRLLVQPNGRN